MPYADELRARAKQKRQMAAELRKFLPLLSLSTDRALFERQAAELKKEAAFLDQQANSRERDP